MGIKEAAIYLDNQWNTYYAGQTVNGRIEYVFDSPKKVRGIHVKFKGEAHTEWSESKEEQDFEGKTQSSDTLHQGNEEYFQISYYLLGSNTGNEIEIPPGRQVYNFTCALPPVLPSSFEGQYGYVRYTVKVTLDRPWKFDQDTKMAFTVINALDLNLNPSYREPIHFQMEKTFCCFCCASPPLSVDVRAPVSGYCPGQVIPLAIDIENKSNVQLHLVKIFLRKVVTYRATTPTTAIKNIIDLDYDIKVECAVSGMHLNLKDRKYITIGTVPLVGMIGQAPPTPSAPIEPSSPSQPAVLPVAPGQPLQPGMVSGGDTMPGGWVAPGAPQPQAPYQTLYPTLTEPVYKESPYTARTIHDRGDSSHMITSPAKFAPYYPTYAAIQPPPLPQ
ncbi:jg4304 [Pararge aegeria aegeria]|uniref:Jg4304 protein n=1 Tax=Pararge aegeria aegeria TaxID=348720 RepID=A0A8S4QV52_9NEOP|nr:jg4304 [Pararge aegeria aegeria]